MSTNQETRSAKSGKALGDQFDPDRPHVVLEGVGRMQRRGVVNVLFDLKIDGKTIPFSSVFRGSSDGAKFVVGGKRFNGKGILVSKEPVPEPKPTAIEPKPIQTPDISESASMPEVSEAALGL